MVKIPDMAEKNLFWVTMAVLDGMLEEEKAPFDIFMSCKMVFTSANRFRNSIQGQQAIIKISNITLELAKKCFDNKDYPLALEACITGKSFAESINADKIINSFLKIQNKIIKSDPKLKGSIEELESINEDWIEKFCT